MTYSPSTLFRLDTPVGPPLRLTTPAGAWLPERPGWIESALSAEARVMTPDGPCAAGQLRSGDRVSTLDDGAFPVLWTHCQTIAGGDLRRRPDLAPVTLPAGALDCGAPRRAVRLSPCAGVHFLWPAGPAGGALVPAADLAVVLRLPAAPQPSLDSVSYVQLLLPDHALIAVEGLLVETLHPGALTARDCAAAYLASLPAPGAMPCPDAPPVRPRARRAL